VILANPLISIEEFAFYNYRQMALSSHRHPSDDLHVGSRAIAAAENQTVTLEVRMIWMMIWIWIL
jgi:hypothetical protein